MHNKPDNYWLNIDGKARVQNLQVPVLLMAGWYDPFLPTQLQDFELIMQYTDSKVANSSQLIIGSWTHADSVKFPDDATAGDYRPASLEPSIDWFDRHLMGKHNGTAKTPVKLFVMGENKWRDEQEWPLARTQYQSYYLHSGGNANTLNGDGRLNTTLSAEH